MVARVDITKDARSRADLAAASSERGSAELILGTSTAARLLARASSPGGKRRLVCCATSARALRLTDRPRSLLTLRA